MTLFFLSVKIINGTGQPLINIICKAVNQYTWDTKKKGKKWGEQLRGIKVNKIRKCIRKNKSECDDVFSLDDEVSCACD